MRKRTVVIGAVVAAALAAPIAEAFRMAPLSNREGVVVHWRAKNKVAVIAHPDGRLRAVHALRRVAPGTRVRVDGIKWGTPTPGIKWGTPGQGIKWGIKWGRNGSYQSRVSKKAGRKAVWTPVRGPIVKKFGNRAVAVGTPGAVVVVRIGAVRGSSGFSREMALPQLPPVGSTISLRVEFGRNGIKVGRNIRYLKPPVPGANLPVAGTIVSMDPATRTMVLLDNQDRAYPVRFTVTLPAEFSFAPYAIGEDVAVEGQLTPQGDVRATLIAQNGSFAEADDPAGIQVVTTDTPSCTNADEGACPDTPSGGSSPQSGQPGIPPTSSPSTPPPSTPPGTGGGVPPPPPPPPSPPPPPPPPGDGDPPAGCRTPPSKETTMRHGDRRPPCRPCPHNRPKHGEHRPPKCRPDKPTKPPGERTASSANEP